MLGIDMNRRATVMAKVRRVAGPMGCGTDIVRFGTCQRASRDAFSRPSRQRRSSTPAAPSSASAAAQNPMTGSAAGRHRSWSGATNPRSPSLGHGLDDDSTVKANSLRAAETCGRPAPFAHVGPLGVAIAKAQRLSPLVAASTVFLTNLPHHGKVGNISPRKGRVHIGRSVGPCRHKVATVTTAVSTSVVVGAASPSGRIEGLHVDPSQSHHHDGEDGNHAASAHTSRAGVAVPALVLPPLRPAAPPWPRVPQAWLCVSHLRRGVLSLGLPSVSVNAEAPAVDQPALPGGPLPRRGPSRRSDPSGLPSDAPSALASAVTGVVASARDSSTAIASLLRVRTGHVVAALGTPPPLPTLGSWVARAWRFSVCTVSTSNAHDVEERHRKAAYPAGPSSGPTSNRSPIKLAEPETVAVGAILVEGKGVHVVSLPAVTASTAAAAAAGAAAGHPGRRPHTDSA